MTARHGDQAAVVVVARPPMQYTNSTRTAAILLDSPHEPVLSRLSGVPGHNRLPVPLRVVALVDTVDLPPSGSVRPLRPPVLEVLADHAARSVALGARSCPEEFNVRLLPFRWIN